MCSDAGDEMKYVEGDRVVAAGFKKGTIRFIGETKFAPGESMFSGYTAIQR